MEVGGGAVAVAAGAGVGSGSVAAGVGCGAEVAVGARADSIIGSAGTPSVAGVPIIASDIVPIMVSDGFSVTISGVVIIMLSGACGAKGSADGANELWHAIETRAIARPIARTWSKGVRKSWDIILLLVTKVLTSRYR